MAKGTRQIPVARRSRYGSTGIGPGALGFRVADGSPPTVLSSHASLCKASSADATACSWCTYRLIPPAVFDGSRRARQRLRSQRFNRNALAQQQVKPDKREHRHRRQGDLSGARRRTVTHRGSVYSVNCPSEEGVPAMFGGLVSPDLINAFATNRTKPNMNPPTTVPYITEAGT
jgi:hypothetical protein